MNPVAVIFIFVLVSGVVFTMTSSHESNKDKKNRNEEDSSSIEIRDTSTFTDTSDKVLQIPVEAKGEREEDLFKDEPESDSGDVKGGDSILNEDKVSGAVIRDTISEKTETTEADPEIEPRSETEESALAKPSAEAAAPISRISPDILKEVTVQKGNTAYSIAKEHGMRVEELLSLNGLTSPELKVGQKLMVPNSSIEEDAVSEDSLQSKPQIIGRVEYSTYKVTSNNTIFSIAKMHGMSIEELKSLNNIGADNKISYGMILKVRKIKSVKKDQ